MAYIFRKLNDCYFKNILKPFLIELVKNQDISVTPAPHNTRKLNSHNKTTTPPDQK